MQKEILYKQGSNGVLADVIASPAEFVFETFGGLFVLKH